MSAIVLALDLSLRRTGWCADGETGVIDARELRGVGRIDYIARRVQALARGADLAVIEGYSFGSRGRAIFDIAELGGAVRLLLYRLGVPFACVAPSTLKVFATGDGHAGKDAMIAAAIRKFGFQGCDNNEADAFLLWCMARAGYGEQFKLAAKQSGALAKVDWPALGAVVA